MSTAVLSPTDAVVERLITLVLDTLPSPESRRAYRRALKDFWVWCQRQPGAAFTKAIVNAYRVELEAKGLSPSAVNLALAAIRKLAVEAADAQFLAPEVAAAIGRVKGVHRLGTRTGTWLSLEQAERILACPAIETMKGCRDRALLAALIGCGLRRKEAAALTAEHIQLRDARWVIIDLVGKGRRIRTVPMPAWAKVAIDAWTAKAGIAPDWYSGR